MPYPTAPKAGKCKAGGEVFKDFVTVLPAIFLEAGICFHACPAVDTGIWQKQHRCVTFTLEGIPFVVLY